MESGSLPCCSVGYYLHWNQHRCVGLYGLLVQMPSCTTLTVHLFHTDNWCMGNHHMNWFISWLVPPSCRYAFRCDEQWRVVTLTLLLFFVRIVMMLTGEHPSVQEFIMAIIWCLQLLFSCRRSRLRVRVLTDVRVLMIHTHPYLASASVSLAAHGVRSIGGIAALCNDPLLHMQCSLFLVRECIGITI